MLTPAVIIVKSLIDFGRPSRPPSTKLSAAHAAAATGTGDQRGGIRHRIQVWGEARPVPSAVKCGFESSPDGPHGAFLPNIHSRPTGMVPQECSPCLTCCDWSGGLLWR